jgi:hypothetical protein
MRVFRIKEWISFVKAKIFCRISKVTYNFLSNWEIACTA